MNNCTQGFRGYTGGKMRQPILHNQNDPQYDDIEERLEVQDIAREERYEREKCEVLGINK